VKKVLSIFYFVYKLYLTLLFTATAILFFPVLLYTTTKEKHHRKAFKLFAFWSVFFRIMAFWPFKIKENQKLPEGPFIVVANHSSYADIFLTPSLLKNHPHVFLGKSEILSYPVIKYYFKNYNIPVFRGNKMKSTKTLLLSRKKIEKGWSIIIFPEGGIPDHERPKMLPFKDGAFRLAKETNTPILPITFVNNYKLFTDPTDLFGSCRPGFSKIVFHPIIDIEEINEKTASELRDKTFNLINGELNVSRVN
jgi:1-acyl-sn-glycerol-3-phosphate acyltransferase